MFFYEICNFFKNTFFYRTPPVAASVAGPEKFFYFQNSDYSRKNQSTKYVHRL